MKIENGGKILMFARNFVRGLKYFNEMKRMNLEEGGIQKNLQMEEI